MKHTHYTIHKHQTTTNDQRSTTNRQYPIPYPNLNFIHSNSRPIVMVFYDFSRILTITVLLFGLYLCLRGIHNFLFYEVTVSVSGHNSIRRTNLFQSINAKIHSRVSSIYVTECYMFYPRFILLFLVPVYYNLFGTIIKNHKWF